MHCWISDSAVRIAGVPCGNGNVPLAADSQICLPLPPPPVGQCVGIKFTTTAADVSGGCASAAAALGLTASQFEFLNPQLRAGNSSCSLMAGQQVCRGAPLPIFARCYEHVVAFSAPNVVRPSAHGSGTLTLPAAWLRLKLGVWQEHSHDVWGLPLQQGAAALCAEQHCLVRSPTF